MLDVEWTMSGQESGKTSGQDRARGGKEAVKNGQVDKRT
jgi:hypothetical protein